MNIHLSYVLQVSIPERLNKWILFQHLIFPPSLACITHLMFTHLYYSLYLLDSIINTFFKISVYQDEPELFWKQPYERITHISL